MPSITIQEQGKPAMTLAQPSRQPDAWIGPYNLRMESERNTVTRKHLGAVHAKEQPLGNTVATLTFEAHRTCATADDAAYLAATYETTLPRKSAILVYGAMKSNDAVIKSVVADHIGATVHAILVIALGAIGKTEI